MKKRAWFFAFLFLVVLFAFIYLQVTDFSVFKKNAERVRGTGETVTGEATNANLAITITINAPPTIDIIKPKNETYFNNISLDLQFSSAGADFIWYNLDGGANNTITGNTTFNTTSGQHTLYLFANNSNSTVSDNVTFTINLTKFTVLYSNYKNNGSSTDFNVSSFEDIQNLSEIVLERTSHGKISFNEAINLTGDENPGDNILDLDSNTNISQNHIEINTTSLPNFNKSATLSLYGLTFSDPRVLRDGSVCPSAICTEVSYSAGVFIFNVTQFTIYSAEETPSEVIAPSGGGGGAASIKSFNINLEEIIIKLKHGETTTRHIIITNDGNQRLSMSVEETPSIKEFLKISEENFNLEPGESKIIALDFSVKEEAIPNLYLGKIIVKGNGIEKEILTAVEVETRAPLFDIRVNLPGEFLWSLPGDGIYYTVELFNLGDAERPVDVFVEYKLIDSNGNEILSGHETIAVMTKISYAKEIEIPEYIGFGRYVIYVKTTYNEEVASASIWFNVGRRPFPYISNLLIILSLVILIILIVMIIRKLKRKKLRKEEKTKENLKDYKRRIREGMEKHKK